MKTFFVTAGLLILPVVASAQGLEGAVNAVTSLINVAIPMVLALAVLYFFWGLAQYVLSSGDEGKKAEGRNIMIYGIIALFVMVSVWGLIRLLQDTFNLNNTTPTVPQLII
ncbi:MAG: hypothetical protein WD509_02645 [Candidatus Paceibacterota bacterium]